MKSPNRQLVGRRGMLLALAAAAMLVGGLVAAQRSSQTVTVYLVRHAEKTKEPAADPVLTQAGTERALALAEALASAGVGTIYTSDLARTRLTARPLADKLGLTAQAVRITDPHTSQTFVDELAGRLRSEHWGESVVVVSHSNTIPMLGRALGVEIGEIDEATGYDHLFVVQVPRLLGRATLVRARFGARPGRVFAGR